MKILLYSHSANFYGAERSLLDLAEGLARSEHVVSALCPAPGPLSEEVKKLDIPVSYMPFPGIGAGSVREILHFLLVFLPAGIRLRRWMRKNDIQVVYANTINAVLGCFAAALAGIRTVWHIREVKPKNAILTKIAGIIINWISSEAVFNSYATMNAFKQRKSLRWHVVYNGIETNHPFKNKEFSSHFVAGFAGQMADHKKPERFLHVFSRLKSRAPNVRAIMAGDGPMLPKLRSMAEKLKIGDDIRFTGYLSDLDSFYSTIDVLILTSDRESFGRVVLEAMGHGRPVVAAAVGGVSELVEEGKTGYLVAADDIDAYCQKILFLKNHPETCRRMAEAAYRRVSERFCKSLYQRRLIRILVNGPA